MKNYKLVTLTVALSAVLAGCVTMDDFLENLGLKKSNNIQTVYLDPIRSGYEIVSTANVRAAPSINAEVLGTLRAGQRFFALGRTGEWIAIGDGNGSILGYVHASLAREAGTVKKRTRKVAKESPKASTNATSAQTEQSAPSAPDEGLDLDAIPGESAPSTPPAQPAPSKSGGVDLDSL